MSKLIVIKGGKIEGGGGSKGPPPGKDGGGWRPNKYNGLLWTVISRKKYSYRAESYEEVTSRLSRWSKEVLGQHKTFSRDEASYLLKDGRAKGLFYQWMPLHFQKGQGKERGIVAALVDVDATDELLWMVDERDKACVRAGLISSFGTSASMIVNDEHGISMFIGLLEEEGYHTEADELREALKDVKSLAKKAAAILKMMKKII